MRNIKSAFFALLLIAPSALCEEPALQEPKLKHFLYTSPRGTFACEVPSGWQPFEEETLQGSSVHFLGPAEADGAYRAAMHVHFAQKGRPGFVPLEAAIKRERQPDKRASRESGPPVAWRLAKTQARRFETVETRQLPRETLPSRPVVLHHYYVFAPAGDGYFIIKMSTTRETYLSRRPEFERLLSSFQILGYQ